MRTALDPKYLIVMLITLVLVVGEARYSILGGYERLATTLGVSVATEILLSWWLRGRVANVSSAYITGISLALLIWVIAANSHIVKAALEWSMAPSVALVILQNLAGELLVLTFLHP